MVSLYPMIICFNSIGRFALCYLHFLVFFGSAHLSVYFSCTVKPSFSERFHAKEGEQSINVSFAVIWSLEETGMMRFSIITRLQLSRSLNISWLQTEKEVWVDLMIDWKAVIEGHSAKMRRMYGLEMPLPIFENLILIV